MQIAAGDLDLMRSVRRDEDRQLERGIFPLAVHMVVRGAASDDRAGGGEHLVNHPAFASRGEDVVSRTERLLVTSVVSHY
jgi:hypothetical protein